MRDDNQPSELVGSSGVMGAVRRALERLARLPWPVRLEGPSGTGKRVAAHLLHRLSSRRDGPFVPLYLNVLAEGLEISALVGHVRGAFTGATQGFAGAFEAAHGGTLFLDELAAAPPKVQATLLQLVEEGAVRRLGDQRERPLDVRLVFATNVDLRAAVDAGTFRPDLYHRLGSLVVRLPALREHREDIPELVDHFYTEMQRDLAEPLDPLPPAVVDRLQAYDWPGNVRELQHVLQHYVAFGDLPPHLVAPGARALDWREHVDAALAAHGGNKSAAARALKVTRQTLYDELNARNA
jgi:two-component system response regulator HydG